MTYRFIIIALAISWTIMEIQPFHIWDKSTREIANSIFDFWSFGLTAIFLHWIVNRGRPDDAKSATDQNK